MCANSGRDSNCPTSWGSHLALASASRCGTATLHSGRGQRLAGHSCNLVAPCHFGCATRGSRDGDGKKVLEESRGGQCADGGGLVSGR